MRILHTLDDNDYDKSWPRVCREAARAVIVRDGRIALVHSVTEGFYKFPGGGIEAGESHADALVRETLEEVGLRIIPASIRELGMVQEYRRSLYGEEIFDQRSYYYYADVDGTLNGQSLDDYEIELGYELVWAEPVAACNTNRELGERDGNGMILREAMVLECLLDNP